MRYKKEIKTGQNTMSSVIRPQYCTFNTSIAVQHIQMCVQVNHVKQATMRLAYCAGFFFLTKIQIGTMNLPFI